MSILGRKLVRDIRRQKAPFIAVAVTLALGVAVFGAATDAYYDLQGSFDELYAQIQLADVSAKGGDTATIATRAASIDPTPLVATRHQADVPFRVEGDHQLLGRVVGTPTPPGSVDRLLLRDGREAAAPDEAVVEHHLASWFGLGPGSTVEVLGPDGWRTLRITGTAVSGEYVWPARSQQELLTTPEHFGVLFASDATVRSLSPAAAEEVLAYATDRGAVTATTDAFRRIAEEGNAETVVLREENPSVKALADDVTAFGTFATMVPLLFLVAGVLGGYILLSRLIRAQRSLIGTLLACGEPRGRIVRHYLGYGLATGAVGATIGAALGVVLGGWIASAYTGALGVPISVTRIRPVTIAEGLAIGIGASLLAAWLPARKAARTPPAEAMRAVAPPTRGRRTLVERLVPPMRRLPARWRMVLRNLGRNRRRSLFTVCGVTVSLALILIFAGLRDTVGAVLDRQFREIQQQDAEVSLVPGVDATAALAAVPGVARVERSARYDVTATAGDQSESTMLYALEPASTLHRFTGPDGTPVSLREDGVIITEALRSTLGADVGDSIGLRAGPVDVRDRVTAVADEPMAALVYASTTHLAQLAPDVPPNGALLQLDDGADREEVRRAVTAVPGVVAFLDAQTLEQSMSSAFALYETLVGLMLAFGGVMAFALLFNAMSANTAERTVELGTLEAAGFASGRLRRLVAAENLLLTALALPLGIGLGYLLAGVLLQQYETQGYSFDLTIEPATIGLTVAAILAAAVIAQLPVGRAIRHIDVARIVRDRSI